MFESGPFRRYNNLMDTDQPLGLLALDPWLAPYAYQLRQRRACGPESDPEL